MRKEKPDWRVICLGIISLTVIEIFALMNGINGVMMSMIIAVIGLAIGVAIPYPLKR